MGRSVFDWPEVRDQAIDAFRGELPGQQLEADVIAVFELQPERVVRAIDDIGEQLAQGKVRAGWAILRMRLQESARPVAQVTAHGNSREKAVVQAERYISHAGCHYDKWEGELEDEFFGALGSLREWADDEILRQRLHRLWSDARPRAAAAERQQDEDALRRRELRAALKAQREAVRLEGERTSTAALVAAGAAEEF
jgi:hypothetical protein